MLTRLALYCTLGLFLNAIGQDVTTAGFWCVVGLFWAAEHLTRIDTVNDIHEEVERIRQQRKDDKQ